MTAYLSMVLWSHSSWCQQLDHLNVQRCSGSRFSTNNGVGNLCGVVGSCRGQAIYSRPYLTVYLSMLPWRFCSLSWNVKVVQYGIVAVHGRRT